MARLNIDLKLSDLEPTDRIEGYTAERLVKFAMVCSKAGVTDDELKEFCHDCDRIADTLRSDFEQTMHEAIFGSLPDSLKGKA